MLRYKFQKIFIHAVITEIEFNFDLEKVKDEMEQELEIYPVLLYNEKNLFSEKIKIYVRNEEMNK